MGAPHTNCFFKLFQRSYHMITIPAGNTVNKSEAAHFAQLGLASSSIALVVSGMQDSLHWGRRKRALSLQVFADPASLAAKASLLPLQSGETP